ncbi:DUF3604 domain-containing protein [Porticoccaceae bacterium]|nr:DUF3604 domain-containing protein [Porticoccaceae bacterium]
MKEIVEMRFFENGNYWKVVITSFILATLPLQKAFGKDNDTRADFAENNTPQYSPLLKENYPRRAYWGDTHVHTSLSVDAYIWKNRQWGPDSAYRFAKGEPVVTFNGMVAQRDRPLDFIVIADHANSMGLINRLIDEKEEALRQSSRGKKWLKMLAEQAPEGVGPAFEKALGNLNYDMWYSDLSDIKDTSLSVWQSAVDQAEQYNQPGEFTAFIGFEWTPIFNLHRVVIYRDGAERTRNLLPFSSYQSSDPEALWRYLDDYQRETGGEVLAIPHNPNLSQGVMFALEDAKGQPLSKNYAQTRTRWEPLLEVTQMKGDSETHPLLSPNDEFADFERIESMDLSEWVQSLRETGLSDYLWWDQRKQFETNDDWMRPYEYARSALKLGLQQQNQIGVNPFKFGMIGSTDTHTSLSTADENNFWGKLISGGPNPDRMIRTWDGTSVDSEVGQWWGPGWKQNAAGYAAVWAEENTREALFAAMKRKEVYASTGPRINVRFFAGWDYQTDDAFKPDFARIGYEQGVPMGGDLTQAPEGKAPRFLIRAVKDPEGANLDRVQVIKGWRDTYGELHEKIYNVALSDGRKDKGPKTKKVGNTVDVPDASYTNTIGDPELAVVWQDPDFNPDELAFYYLRVLEIPTPRWTAYDAKYFGLKDLPKEVPIITQDRAYTSPIWYTPAEYAHKK